MTTENQYKGVTETIQLTSDNTPSCKFCKVHAGDTFSSQINHYIQNHSFKILHIGTENTTESEAKNPHYITTAILGK